MKQLFKVIFILLILLFNTDVSVRAQPVLQVDSVSELWLDISLGPPLIEWYNQVARPNDIARIENINQLDLLDQVTAGRTLVVFKSIADAERLMPSLAGQVDIIGYNLEQGSQNLAAEQADPIGSARRMRTLADQYGLQLAFGPDRNFALSSGVEIAPFVDIFVLQIQRVQTEPNTVDGFIGPLIPQLRQANPNLEISVQIRTEGDVMMLGDLIDDQKQLLNGVSVLTSPETIEVAMALVSELQTRGQTTGPRSSPAVDDNNLVTAPENSSAADDTAGTYLSPFPLVAGAFVAGLVIGVVLDRILLQSGIR